MNTKGENRVLRGILVILIALIILFIWNNSLQSASVSDGTSLGLLHKIDRVLEMFGLNGIITNGRLRKLAHASEFMALGFFLMAAVRSFGSRKTIPVLFTGVMVALCDETIQMRSPGRSAEVRDVWIDFIGFVAGCIVVFLIEAMVRWGRTGSRKM